VVLVYLSIAVALTWPAVLPGAARLPGAERTDLYNSLWSVWFFQDAVWRGVLPHATTLLDHPGGGALLVADLPGALWGTVLVPVLGLPGAYTAIVCGRLTLAGAAAHGLAREWLGDGRAAFVAGVGFELAPVVLSGVHNGTSEAFAVAPVALAAWAALRLARGGGWGRAVATGFALLLSALASWYAAVVAFLFVGAILLVGRWPQSWARRLFALALGVALVLPWAAAFHAAATGPDNLVGIKHARELAGVRRTTGAADPRGWVAVGDFRAPDFREMSRYDEQFIHCHYLGWGLLLLAPLGLRRRNPGTAALALAGGAGLLLAMGPVVTLGGAPWIFAGDRAMPLPYFLVERLPGFSSLSLLWRLGLAPALTLALLGAAAVAGRRWAPAAAVLAVMLDGLLLSPVGRPATAPAGISPAIRALADAPDGAVLNFPVVGGRAYLYEQTAHGKPLAGTLNFPNNAAGRKVWQALGAADEARPDAARATVARRARAAGVRYLVVHPDALARPDMHDAAVRTARALYAPLPSEAGGVEVYDLW
jgi:hypothetical protein